jgi:hypothetical protein
MLLKVRIRRIEQQHPGRMTREIVNLVGNHDLVMLDVRLPEAPGLPVYY